MLEVVLGWRIALVILSTWPALCAARATTWPQICLAVGLPSYLSVSLPLSLFLTFVKRSSIEFNRRLFCALPFQKMTTRWAHSMSCWAVRIVVHSASCPSSWHNCVRNWPCPYSPVSAGILFLYILNIYILYISYIYLSLSLCRNYASFSERTWGCASSAAAVSAALVAEHGAGRNECATCHAPLVYYGKFK